MLGMHLVQRLTPRSGVGGPEVRMGPTAGAGERGLIYQRAR